MKSKLMLLLLLVLLPALGQAEIINIDNARFKELLAQQVPVVDVRTAVEWSETGIVAGSQLLTFFAANGTYDAGSWLAQLAPIADQEAPVILICRTGRRTGIISKFMAEQVGYTTVYNVTRGISHWISAGNPTVPPK